jgi:hypothetical protein
MSCCGQKREQYRQQRTFVVAPVPAPPGPTQKRTPVVFLGTGAYLVTGPHSGVVYRFSQGEPAKWIDARDAEVLLKTRFFQREN